MAKLATLPKEEEYQDLEIRGIWKIANFANSLPLAYFHLGRLAALGRGCLGLAMP